MSEISRSGSGITPPSGGINSGIDSDSETLYQTFESSHHGGQSGSNSGFEGLDLGPPGIDSSRERGIRVNRVDVGNEYLSRDHLRTHQRMITESFGEANTVVLATAEGPIKIVAITHGNEGNRANLTIGSNGQLLLPTRGITPVTIVAGRPKNPPTDLVKIEGFNYSSNTFLTTEQINYAKIFGIVRGGNYPGEPLTFQRYVEQAQLLGGDPHVDAHVEALRALGINPRQTRMWTERVYKVNPPDVRDGTPKMRKLKDRNRSRNPRILIAPEGFASEAGYEGLGVYDTLQLLFYKGKEVTSPIPQKPRGIIGWKKPPLAITSEMKPDKLIGAVEIKIIRK